jgi:hypothetical protein
VRRSGWAGRAGWMERAGWAGRSRRPGPGEFGPAAARGGRPPGGGHQPGRAGRRPGPAGGRPGRAGHPPGSARRGPGRSAHRPASARRGRLAGAGRRPPEPGRGSAAASWLRRGSFSRRRRPARSILCRRRPARPILCRRRPARPIPSSGWPALSARSALLRHAGRRLLPRPARSSPRPACPCPRRIGGPGAGRSWASRGVPGYRAHPRHPGRRGVLAACPQVDEVEGRLRPQA